MKSATDPVKTLFDVVDARGIAGLAKSFTIGASAAGSELLAIVKACDHDRGQTMSDPAIPAEGRLAVAARRAREARAKLADWRTTHLAKLDEMIRDAIASPQREPIRESVLALMFGQLAALDTLQLETLYTNPATPPEVAAAIEQLPPRLQGGPIPVVAPRLSDAARSQRAWIEAAAASRERAEGLRALRAHLAAAAGSAEAALTDEGA